MTKDTYDHCCYSTLNRNVYRRRDKKLKEWKGRNTEDIKLVLLLYKGLANYGHRPNQACHMFLYSL